MEFNKYQQGGAMGQQNLEQQVTQLVQAAAAGDQKATQQIEQIMKAAQQGNQDAIQIAQVIQKVIQGLKAKQGIRARLGAKLDYINKLKGNCPEGEELVYLEKGGRVCPVCQKKAEKAEKAKFGIKTELNEIDKFKNRRINPSDTVWVDGDKKKARTLTDDRNKPIVKGMKPYSAAEYQKDMARGKKGDKAAARRVEKQNEKTMYACGGKQKLKKRG